MAPTLTKTPAGSERIEAAAKALRLEEAKKARNIGQYSDSLRRRSQKLMTTPTETPDRNENPSGQQENSAETIAQMNVDERQKLAATLQDNAEKSAVATGKFADLNVEQSLAGTNTMGRAGVGQGRQTVEMNSDLLVESHTTEGGKQLADTGGHEVDHAEKQGSVIGPLKVRGKDVKKGDINEAKSEFAGGAEVSRGETQHRKNQPQNYTDAQNNGIAVKKIVGDTTFNNVTEEGDTLKLQKGIWQNELENGSINLADVLSQGAELDQLQQLGYHKAAHEVITQHILNRTMDASAGMHQQ